MLFVRGDIHRQITVLRKLRKAFKKTDELIDGAFELMIVMKDA